MKRPVSRFISDLKNEKNKSKTLILIFIICIGSVYLLYHMSFRKIEFEQIASETSEHMRSIYYTNIKSLDDVEALGLSNEVKQYNFDFRDHTYIITFGYEMKKIKYSPLSKPPHYRDHLEYDHIPKIWLKKSGNNVYIYELKERVNVDYNMHKSSDKVYRIN